MNQKPDLGDPNEPYDFTELVRRNPSWLDDFPTKQRIPDWKDTIPTSPADFDDPRLDRKRDRDISAITGLCWGIAPTIIIALLAYWVFR